MPPSTPPLSAPRPYPRWWPVASMAVAIAILIPHALWFNFLSDDAYISFRYARNLALHGELVFNLGERVEGYTNFLWTILLAGFIKLGIGPEIASRALGMLLGVAGLFVVGRLGRDLDGGRWQPGQALAPLILAGSSAYACWCTGGLETQLFAFLVITAIWLLLREMDRQQGFASAAVFALAAMTRPEGTLLFGLAAGFRVASNLLESRRVRPRKAEWMWVALFVLIFAPYFAWRWNYYGWLFPNTYYVKSTGGGAGMAMGLYYLRRFAEDHALWFVAPLILAGFGKGNIRITRFRAHATLIAIVFAAYVARVGGDFMGLYRFLLLLLPLGALLVQESLRTLAARLQPVVGQVPLAIAGALLLAGFGLGSYHTSREAMVTIGADRGIDTPGYLQHYVDERVPIGKWFATHARPDDLMTLGGAGVIAYYADIRGYDVFGLVDEKIAHDPNMSSGQNRPGHQKWGSDDYMISRRPTLITHLYQIHTRHAPDAELWRARGYEWVTAEIPNLSPPPLYSFLKRSDRPFGPFPATTTPR